MCKTRRAVDAATPVAKPKPTASPSPSTSSNAVHHSSSATSDYIRASPLLSSASSSSFSADSIAANIRLSLSQHSHHFHLYSFAEILSATDHFLASPLSPSGNSWRCRLRGADAVIFRRPFCGDPAALPSRVATLIRSHHRSVADLLGASISGDHIYLVYSYVVGASLDRCLRNPKNPSFTPLSSWLSRIQVAADLAQGLEYIHHHSEMATPDSRRRQSGTVHKRMKSSGVIITENGLRAKICHFGAAELAGEILAGDGYDDRERFNESIRLEAKLSRSRSQGKKIEGTRGYMAPELLAGGPVSRQSDVFAFGVVLLELLSGEEPLRYRFCKESTDTIEKVSLIETARAAVVQKGETAAVEAEEDRRRIRQWVDRRLGDSFPVEAAHEVVRLALRCVAEEAEERPEMVWVAGKLSKLLLQARAWDEKVKTTPTRYLTSVVAR
ncbi:hypothetical protein Cni_G08762 [Canna indica]|uniref:Protein kinase domain-containing protein n=1 Tax=Canna indica TaxID=4628 RepID=A0AAQ3K2R8_9LILI|nr:hypothetical protein Cni_G08762 [Canna indica]